MGFGGLTNSRFQDHSSQKINQNSGYKFYLLQKAEVGQQVLERYLALEDEIAQAEQNSPKMALDQKKSQVETLRAKITEQQVLVEKLEEST